MYILKNVKRDLINIENRFIYNIGSRLIRKAIITENIQSLAYHMKYLLYTSSQDGGRGSTPILKHAMLKLRRGRGFVNIVEFSWLLANARL